MKSDDGGQFRAQTVVQQAVKGTDEEAGVELGTQVVEDEQVGPGGGAQEHLFLPGGVRAEVQGLELREEVGAGYIDDVEALFQNLSGNGQSGMGLAQTGVAEEHQALAGSLKELKPEQHFTQPPAHYTEASLVKTMEELGIGRPSTYAPTITTIISRRYVAKEQKNLYVTELGEVVNNIMKQAFPSIVDVNFTATMEGLLDCVAAGTVKWKTVVSNFYPDLKKDVDAAEEELEKVDIQDEVTDVICENCGRHMVIKYGPHGRFLACPGFPECKNTKPYFEKIGVACPKCGKEIVLKKTKKGRKYYGCEDNPDCDFMSWQKPSAKKCPKCGSYMVEKGNKLVCSQETCGYVEAKDEKE